MRCPECVNARTKVLDTRISRDSNEKHNAILRRGGEVWAWWEPEGFRVRKRQCGACKHSFFSIEVGIEDLNQAIDDLRQVNEIQRKRVIDLERHNDEMRQIISRVKS